MMPTPDDSRQEGFLNPFAGIPAREVCKPVSNLAFSGEPDIHDTHILFSNLLPPIYGTPISLRYSRHHQQI